MTLPRDRPRAPLSCDDTELVRLRDLIERADKSLDEAYREARSSEARQQIAAALIDLRDARKIIRDLRRVEEVT